MSIATDPTPETADKSIVILESLLCLLRERNILSRADIEELCAKVKDRADHHGAAMLRQGSERGRDDRLEPVQLYRPALRREAPPRLKAGA
jgi:hypothetical protein